MTQVSSAFIDLTMDEDSSSASHSTRESSDGYIPAVLVSQAPYTTAAGKMSFSSHYIKELSSSRVEYTRLPDIMQQDQKKQVYNASQPVIFTGWIQEHEESSAVLTLTNDNDNDPERFPPADWAYTDGYVLDKSLEKPSRQAYSNLLIPKGCGCDNELGICDPKTCRCYALHEELAPNPWLWHDKIDGDDAGKKIASEIKGNFAYCTEGRLRNELVYLPGTPVWECNSNCSCSGDCSNRVVQKGRTVAFDLFKSTTPYIGWGIRTKYKIKAGTFISVYAGELLEWSESEDRGLKYDSTDTTYILDIDNYHIKESRYCEPYKNYMKETHNIDIELDHEASTIDKAEVWAKVKLDDKKMTYSVDAGLWGNLSRYFNHSCNPNMQMHPVYTEERDIRRPFLAFFAKRDINEYEELTFAYDSQGDEHQTEEAHHTTAIIPAAEVALQQLQSRDLGTEVIVKSSDRKHNNVTSMKCGCRAANCRGVVFRRGD